MPLPLIVPFVLPPQESDPAPPSTPPAPRLRDLEGVELTARYLYEAFHVVDGPTGVNGNLDLIASFDLELLLGLEDLRGSAYFLANHGDALTEEIGDFQVTSNIEAPEAARLYELWLDQRLADGRVSVRGGIQDLTTEFDVIPSGQLFIHSSPGTGAEFAASGVTGPSTFPISSLAARLELRPSEGTFARFAVGDGVPGDPDDLTSNELSLSSEEGAVFLAEAGRVSPNSKLALGAWGYTTEFERPGGGRSTGSSGVYAFVDQPLLTDGRAGGRGLNLFLRAGYADDRNSVLDRYVGGGVVQRAPFPSREHDRVGLAVAAARFSRDSDDWETALELTYSARVTEWFSLQPDLQWVIDPNGTGARDDAVLVGLRGTVTF